MTTEELIEIRKVHALVQRIWTAPKQMRLYPEDQALVDKWAPIDVMGMLIREVTILNVRIAQLEKELR
jgi:hypothetical protein